MDLMTTYPELSPEQLVDHWANTHDHENVISAPGVLSALRTPDCTPVAIASVDLCEVVRGTLHSMLGVFGVTEEAITSYSHYGPNFGIDNDLTVAIVQTLMNSDMVQPVDDIEEISEIMQEWRKLGIYCVANTSTLPGCEAATIDFLGRHLPEGFDGILLPRNALGDGPLTKGHALGFAIEAVADPTNVAAVHIDDAPHHNKAVNEHVGTKIGRNNTTTLMPTYVGNVHPEGTVAAEDPIDAFRRADQILRLVVERSNS